METDSAAVVLLSGGQDSTTCFHLARSMYDRVEAVSFDYGQRHRVELDLAKATAAKYGVPHTMLPVEALQSLGAASLTNTGITNTPGGASPEDGSWHARHDLPPSFVPGRNLLFFTLAAAYAIPRDITRIVTGVCQQDRAGYPDCRAEFVDAMRQAIAVGMDEPSFDIIAPLLHLSKAETWALAADLGVTSEIVLTTHTCYEGNRSDLHDWGYGCGVCGACTERARGYREWLAAGAPAPVL